MDIGTRHFRVAALIAVMAMAPLARAQEADPAHEDQLKAAYLFNFMKFVEWPASAPQQPLTMCFVGAGAVREALARIIAGKKIGEHSILARDLQGQESSVSAGCSLVYFDARAAAERKPGSQSAEPILTVSDASGFAREGGMIELYTQSNRLRFIINLAAAQRAGLHVSPSLLQLAMAIEKGGAQ